MFFVDKYYPKNINESSFHKKLLKRLNSMAKDESIPHIIFHGVTGSGKKTIINLFLNMLYGEEVNKLVSSTYMVSGSGNSVIAVEVKKSNYHIIIVPNNNNFDRYLIQNVVKEYVKKIPLNIFNVKRTFKTVMIQNIDNMSYYAQTSLRRTMEKYSSCRFIMWSRSLSKVIDPLRSRCLCIRVNRPPKKLLFKKIFDISVLEKIKLNYKLVNSIINKSDGNIKKILWYLELIKNKQYLKINKKIIRTYHDKNENITYKIIKENDKTYVIKLKNNYFLDESIPYYKINIQLEKLDSSKIKDKIKNKVKNLYYVDYFNNNNNLKFIKENYNQVFDKVIHSILNGDYNFKNIIEEATLYDLNIIKDKIKEKNKKSLYLIDNKIEFLDNNYDSILGEIIKLMLTCDINKIIEIRNLLYNIMITNINGSIIIKDITTSLLNNKNIPDLCMYSIIKYSCLYDHSIARSRREIIHLDGFIIKVMRILYDCEDYDP
jgi:DNA polymerase III delta prime subunit